MTLTNIFKKSLCDFTRGDKMLEESKCKSSNKNRRGYFRAIKKDQESLLQIAFEYIHSRLLYILDVNTLKRKKLFSSP